MRAPGELVLGVADLGVDRVEQRDVGSKKRCDRHAFGGRQPQRHLRGVDQLVGLGPPKHDTPPSDEASQPLGTEPPHPVRVGEVAHDHHAGLGLEDPVEARTQTGEHEIEMALHLVRQRDMRRDLAAAMRDPRRLRRHRVITDLREPASAADHQLRHRAQVALVALQPAQQLLERASFTAAGLSSTTSTPSARSRATSVR